MVEDIRIEGLKRVSAKTVFSELPVKVNTEVSNIQLQRAVRVLFKTGFFSDVDIARDGHVLILSVVERPVINRIGVTGNNVIPTEPLLDGLKTIGLSEGEIFNQSALERIERELNAQYSAIGRYATQIQTRVQELPQNQVHVAIEVIEGNVANIKHINIVGNSAYTEDELQDLFEIKKTGRWSWLTGSDKYAQQKLAGDIDRLKSFYFNRGYLEFEATSTQVSLSPDKETVYITVNIFEGQPYTVKKVDIAGDPIISVDEITALLKIKEGDTFSQESLTTSSKDIQKRLGDEGYSYANVNGVPALNKEEKTAEVTFFINPGSIVYVRRIIFQGNTTTQDNVLRREMKQLEGAPASTEKMAQSKLSLERLSLFSNVEMTTKEVPGRNDQIDIVFTVTEQNSGSFTASVGFTQDDGLRLGFGLQQKNWLGTGDTLGFNIARSSVNTDYSFSYTHPYFTKDGVSRGINIFYRERDLEELDISSFSTDRFGFNLNFGYPISNRSRLSFGFGFENISIQAGTQAVQEISSSPRLRSGVSNFVVTEVPSGFLDTNGNGFFDENDDSVSGTQSGAQLTTTQRNSAATPEGFLDVHGDDFNTINFNMGWVGSSLNKGVFPTKGSSQRLNVEFTAPGGDLELYKIRYRGELYASISKNLVMRFKTHLGYADSYGDIDVLPFFENFFSGGSSSVRGFEGSSLGPKGTPAESYIAVPRLGGGFAYLDDAADSNIDTYTDTRTQTLGGNILVETGVELIFPVPFTKNAKSVRSLFFVDAGNVFSDSCTATQKNCSNVDLTKLSSAAGLGIQWLSPVGPLSVYFSKALQEQDEDQTESFQFSLGQSF